MSDHIHEKQLTRHVHALYNYNVGQQAGLGVVLLIVFLAAAFVFAAAELYSTFSDIAAGLARMH
jgi:hypothetical protein